VLAGFLGNGMKDRTDWGYFWVALIFAVIGITVMLYSFFGIKEKIYMPPHKLNARKSIKTILKDNRMLVLIICAFLTGASNVGAMFLPYFARWNCIGILPMENINLYLENITGKNPNLDAVSILPTILSIMSGISYMLSMLLIPPLLKKMSKKQLWILVSIAGAAANFITYKSSIYTPLQHAFGIYCIFSA
jgi:Na+/melibiose symporter-like transporter